MNGKFICGYFSAGSFHFTCKITLSVMTWKFCSVFGCDNSEKKKIACVEGCKHLEPLAVENGDEHCVLSRL